MARQSEIYLNCMVTVNIIQNTSKHLKIRGNILKTCVYTVKICQHRKQYANRMKNECQYLKIEISEDSV